LNKQSTNHIDATDQTQKHAEQFAKVKAYILDGTPKQISNFVGLEHVNSSKDWDRIGKAGHIANSIDELNETPESLSEELGMPRPIVSQLYNAYHHVVEYAQKYDINDYRNIFTIFDEFERQKKLTTLVKTDPAKMEWIIKLIHDGKVTDGSTVRKLARIASLTNPDRIDAIKELDSKKGNIESAIKYMKTKPRKDTWEQVSDALSIIKNIPHTQMVFAAKDNSKTKLLADIVSVTTGLLQDIQKMQHQGAVQN